MYVFSRHFFVYYILWLVLMFLFKLLNCKTSSNKPPLTANHDLSLANCFELPVLKKHGRLLGQVISDHL